MTGQPYHSESDNLAVGLTRAPQFMGVSIRLFFGNLVLCVLICINAHTWFGLPLFVFLHLLMVRLSIKDPDFLYIRVKSFIKTPPIYNFYFYDAVNSYEPW